MTLHAGIAHRRLFAQRLLGNPSATVAETVLWMGAMQAQDYAHALWGIGARTARATLATIEAAISARQIVRTWPMRGTIHFVPASDAQWMLALCASRKLAGEGLRQRQLGLDAGILDRCAALVREVLHNAEPMPRPALLRVFEDHEISTEGQRGYHILVHLSQRGILCLGPMSGKQPTFVLLDEWVTSPTIMSREDGIRELARRYFVSHGPATVHDFANWSGLTISDTRRALESLDVTLESEVIDGVTYWSQSAHAQQEQPSALQLLPGFDEFLLGYRDRGAVLPPAHSARVVPGNNGVFKPMLVEHGQVVGTWSRSIKAGGVALSLEFFAPGRRRAKSAVEAACQRYAAFLGSPILSIAVS